MDKHSYFPRGIRVHRVLLAMCAALVGSAANAADFKSGIDVTYSGTPGTDYQIEQWYHHPEVMDRKTVYIRSTTDIRMAGNALNTTAAGYFQNVAPNVGTIRYKVDGDLLKRGSDFKTVGWGWSSKSRYGEFANTWPAYSSALRFDSMIYAFDGGPVLGAIGDNGVNITTNPTEYYHYGMRDSVGDEWHTIGVAHDNAGIISDPERRADDGKIHYYVVNPKTPALVVKPNGPEAKFYTTPAKTYYVPKIHDQVTYFEGHVTVTLDDLYSADVVYRLNGGSWVTKSEPFTIDTTTWANGTNRLEYYANRGDKPVKTRVFVKEPDYPSAGESHGYFFFGGNAEGLTVVSNRLSSYPYKQPYDLFKGDHYWNKRDKLNAHLYTGERYPYQGVHYGNPFSVGLTAFVSLIEGTNYPSGSAWSSHFVNARKGLVDNLRGIDPLGLEYRDDGDPAPATEVNYRGYYDMNAHVDLAIAYDIMIGHFRADQIGSAGISPVEDYKVRDDLASMVHDALSWTGDRAGMPPGMWGNARNVAAMMCAMLMPDYETPYYGTSGFNGTSTTVYEWTPFRDDSATWKSIMLDNITTPTLNGYPNQVYPFDPSLVYEGDVNHPYYGHWGNKINYAGFTLYGHASEMYANLLAMNNTSLQEHHRLGLERAIRGTLLGLDGDGNLYSEAYRGPSYFSSPLVLNRQFPAFGSIGIPKLLAAGNDSPQGAIRAAKTIGLFWFDVTATNATAQVSPPAFSPPGGSYSVAQSVSIASATSGATIYYTTDGTPPTASSRVYTSPIPVADTTTLQAMAVKSGLAASPMRMATYTLATPQVASPVFNPPGGALQTATQVSITTATAGATVHYTTDGSNPTAQSQAYSGPISVTSSTTLKARAIKAGEVDSPIVQHRYDFRVAAPVFSPNGGVSATPIAVTLATSTPDSVIYYTTDGSLPTTSSAVYNGGLLVDATSQLQAIATKPGLGNSEVVGATFQIGDLLSDTDWSNIAISPQDGVFTFSYDFITDATEVNAVIGLSNGSADWFDDLGPIVRFFNNGLVDARNGAEYASEVVFPFQADVPYRVRMVINVSTRTYDAFVSGPNGIETKIADHYAFRTEQAQVTELNNLAFVSYDAGYSFILYNLELEAPGGAVKPISPRFVRVNNP